MEKALLTGHQFYTCSLTEATAKRKKKTGGKTLSLKKKSFVNKRFLTNKHSKNKKSIKITHTLLNNYPQKREGEKGLSI